MKVKTLAIAAAALAVSAANAAVTDFTVNGQKVTAAQQEQIINNIVSRGQQRTPQLEAAVKNDLIAQTALLQAANKSGIEKEAPVQAALRNARNQIVTEAFIGKYLRANPVTDAEVQQLYQRDKAAYGDTEYHLRHFTVKTEAEAQKALDRVKTGEAFEKVAAEVSLDQGSKQNGGDIGWQAPVTILPPVANVVKTMKAGQTVAKPIALGNGFDVVQVVETRAAQNFPTLEQAKPQLTRILTQQKAAAYVKSIADKAEVK